MKSLLILMCIFQSTYVLADNESEMSAITWNLSAKIAANRINGLREVAAMLKSGSAIEKDAALYAFERDILLEITPDVIASIDDLTPGPRYDDTGWSSIGYHANWALGVVARKIDKEHFDKMSFNGTTEEIKQKWMEWWQQFKTRPQPGGSPYSSPAAGSESGDL